MAHHILIGDAREQLATLPAGSVQTCVTSPPYFGLRSYLPDDHPEKALEIGLEGSVEAYVSNLVAVFREVRRVLRDDGTLWLNLGDSYASGGTGGYSEKSTLGGFTNPDTKGRVMNGQPVAYAPPAGLKPKDLIGIPWRVALALQADGWYLRQDIIWHKTNPMPESVRDRCTKAHEYVFMLSKSARYYYDAEAVKEPATQHAQGSRGNHAGQKMPVETGNGRNGSTLKAPNRTTRNRRSVWTISTKPYKGAHFAVFPPELPEVCILAGSRPGDTVLDPFGGSGTTAQVADRHGRHCTLIDLNPANLELMDDRLERSAQLPLTGD